MVDLFTAIPPFHFTCFFFSPWSTKVIYFVSYIFLFNHHLMQWRIRSLIILLRNMIKLKVLSPILLRLGSLVKYSGDQDLPRLGAAQLCTFIPGEEQWLTPGMKGQAGHTVQPVAVGLCPASHKFLQKQPKASLAAFPMDEALAFEPELFMLASAVKQKTGREKAFLHN